MDQWRVQGTYHYKFLAPEKNPSMSPKQSLEIEVKFFVESPARVRNFFNARASFHKPMVFERNTLWDNKQHSIQKQGALLRLRMDDACRLTFKSPAPLRLKDTNFKISRETETHVADCKAMEAILEAMGFGVVALYEKERETWRYGGVEATLDRMPFGNFMELEGRPEPIRALAREMGMDWSRRITLTYMEIFSIIRKREAQAPAELSFRAFGEHPVDVRKYLCEMEAGPP